MALLRWPLLLGILVLVLQVLYRFGPSRQRARWRWVSWGAIGAAGLWLIASMLFSWYVANFAHYDRTYGSLGAAVGFMTWMWISTTVVLLGAELNAEIEHQTAVDSTTGAPEPMGQRGARMADTLGETRSAAKPKPPDDPSMADPRAVRARGDKRTS
jgi:membrane protein